MQVRDDDDHAVFVHAARGERAFVMDPLGRGSYGGRWVPREDLSQFASAFTTASGSPYCAVVKRGARSRVERLRQTLAARLATVQAELGTARGAALDDAVRAINSLPR
jgi:hypothetical protein